jgi:hypothetical protein
MRTACVLFGCFAGFGPAAPESVVGINGSDGDTAPGRVGCILIGPGDVFVITRQLALAEFVRKIVVGVPRNPTRTPVVSVGKSILAPRAGLPPNFKRALKGNHMNALPNTFLTLGKPDSFLSNESSHSSLDPGSVLELRR